MNRFFSHDESDEREFQRAMDEFKSRIPDLAQSLRDHLDEAHKKNRKFKEAFAAFMSLCRASLNPELSDVHVDEMLIQHLLTERLMRNLFQNPEFTKRNVIAAQVENVIEALASASFSKQEFLKKLDPYYTAIERAGAEPQPLHGEAGFSQLGIRAVFPAVLAGCGRYPRHRLHAARNRGLHVQLRRGVR